MAGAQGEGNGSGNGAKDGSGNEAPGAASKPSAASSANATKDNLNLEQIEYLLFQSTQGIHFVFENSEIARVLARPNQETDFFKEENMDKVQGLLSGFLDRASLVEKKSFLESLPDADYELLLRAYFQLVDNTILAHSDLRH